MPIIHSQCKEISIFTLKQTLYFYSMAFVLKVLKILAPLNSAPLTEIVVIQIRIVHKAIVGSRNLLIRIIER